MTAVLVATLVALIGTAATYWHRAQSIRRPPTLAVDQTALYERALRMDYRTPDHQIVAWTPEEREAFGINETMRWIAATQRILNEHEWAELTAKDDDEVVEVRAWGRSEPVIQYRNPAPRTLASEADSILSLAAAGLIDQTRAELEIRNRRFEKSPTVTGGRVFG